MIHLAKSGRSYPDPRRDDGKQKLTKATTGRLCELANDVADVAIVQFRTAAFADGHEDQIC